MMSMRADLMSAGHVLILRMHSAVHAAATWSSDALRKTQNVLMSTGDQKFIFEIYISLKSGRFAK